VNYFLKSSKFGHSLKFAPYSPFSLAQSLTSYIIELKEWSLSIQFKKVFRALPKGLKVLVKLFLPITLLMVSFLLPK
jgi:hypothetical protein